ncbi:MAG TPA: triose-phosphate isomerase [Dehalococcoidia bacterium]|nr:triose-phosphate isomerase [Dehalococcoidia bacterium]
MPRTPIIAGNWKMNTTIDQAVDLARSVRNAVSGSTEVEVVLCPPFVSLMALREVVAGSTIGLGAQNAHYLESGAYTGEVSPVMLEGLCRYVILGHSERRRDFAETDEIVQRKVAAALKAGLTPILCVGERLEERQAGQTEAVLVRQLRGALADLADPQGLVIAYEPVWAIGTGQAATTEQAQEAIALLRHEFAALYSRERSEAVRIQYGGSVTGDNAAELMAQPDIDGALVGGASLRAEEFARIVRAAAEAKRRR